MEYRLRKSEDNRLRPWQAWSINFCIQKHFSDPEFNAFRYSFSLPNFSEQAFLKRRDKYFYEKLSQRFPLKDDFIEYCLANVIEGEKHISSYKEDNHLALRKRWETLGVQFAQDCKLGASRYDLESFLGTGNNTYPPIIQMFLDEQISPETVIIFDIFTKFLSNENKKIQDGLLWPEIFLKLKKYSLFLTEINRSFFREIILREFNAGNKKSQ